MMRLDGIQVGRGMAAILVVLAHSEQAVMKYFGMPTTQGGLYFGVAGVDFFFVLSGFIIWWVHSKDIGSRSALPRYAYKRFIRIYPPYWVALACVISIFALSPDAGTGRELEPNSLIRAIALLPNPDGQILVVAWTLCYEVLFYLLFGVLIFWPPAGSLLMAAWLLFALSTPDPGSLLFSPYPVHFALGMAAAFCARKFKPQGGTLLFILGVSLFAITAAVGIQSREQIGSWCYAVSSMLTLLGLARIDIATKFKWPTPLLLCGNASYSIYLVHYPVVVGLGKAGAKLAPDTHPTIALALSVAIALVAGLIFHFVIERQILLFGSRRQREASAS